MIHSITVAALLLHTAVVSAAPSQKEVAEKPTDSRDKMICKRFLETGSLVRGYRTCKTKAEWQRERDDLRQLNPTQSCSRQGDGGGC